MTYVGSSWMLQAAAAPPLFLTRGFARFVARMHAESPRARTAASARKVPPAFSVEVPRELAAFLTIANGRAIGDFVPGDAAIEAFGPLLGASRRSPRARAKLCALLAGAVPFGRTRSGELWLYVLGAPTSPARGVIATLDPAVPGAPSLSFGGISTFAFACALEESAAAGEDASRVTELRTRLPTPGVAEQESVRAAFERATALLDLIDAADVRVRRAAKKLASRPFEPPHPPAPATSRRAKADRAAPLALGPLVEAFFRSSAEEAATIVQGQRRSNDALVRDAALLLEDALSAEAVPHARRPRRPRTAPARDLARRRAMARRAAVAVEQSASASAVERARRTRLIIEQIDMEAQPTIGYLRQQRGPHTPKAPGHPR